MLCACSMLMCVYSGIRELHISSCCVWELFSVTSAQAELHRQEMNRLPLSALVSHKALPVTGRTLQLLHTLGKDLDWQKETHRPLNRQQTCRRKSIYTASLANCAQVRFRMLARMNAHALDHGSKEMPIWMIDADAATYAHATEQLL